MSLKGPSEFQMRPLLVGKAVGVLFCVEVYKLCNFAQCHHRSSAISRAVNTIVQHRSFLKLNEKLNQPKMSQKYVLGYISSKFMYCLFVLHL